MVTLHAHVDGRAIVLDEPLPQALQTGTRLRVRVETVDEPATNTSTLRNFQPLNIRIPAEVSNAIALEPEFNVEE